MVSALDVTVFEASGRESALAFGVSARVTSRTIVVCETCLARILGSKRFPASTVLRFRPIRLTHLVYVLLISYTHVIIDNEHTVKAVCLYLAHYLLIGVYRCDLSASTERGRCVTINT